MLISLYKLRFIFGHDGNQKCVDSVVLLIVVKCRNIDGTGMGAPIGWVGWVKETDTWTMNVSTHIHDANIKTDLVLPIFY